MQSKLAVLNKLLFLAIFSLSLLSQIAYSQNASLSDSQVSEIKKIRAALTLTQPGMMIGDIIPSPIAGVYQVSLPNDQVLYASSDAKFFIPGDLYELMPHGLVNTGEQRRNVSRLAKISALDESEMIIYEAEDERKATLTVFTDVDCPYCRKLHADVEQLNELGITVRYLGFPRTGLDTETYFKMVSTWCAEGKDRQTLFTSVTRGGDVAPAECDNPIAEHYQLGRQVGVTGTPALVLEDGTIIPGYVPAETLAGYLLDSQ